MKIFSSWDDYSPQNLELVNLLLKYKIPSIFFIECNSEEKLKQIKQISEIDRLVKIGSHSINHPQDLKLLSDEEAWKEIKGSKDIIENLIRKQIDWFCLPRGRGDERICNLIYKAGYKYIRTTNVFSVENIKQGVNHTTLHVSYPWRKEYNGVDMLKLVDEYLEKAKKKNGLFHFWGHIFEIERYSLWNELEQILKILVSEIR